jgi:hypothetical protein
MKGRITEPDVRNMFKMRSKGKSIEDIASRFGVHPQNIVRILDGRKWPSVTGPILAAEREARAAHISRTGRVE